MVGIDGTACGGEVTANLFSPAMPYTTILSAPALHSRLGSQGWVVFDVRHDLMDVAAGEAAYRGGHIPGARFLHLDRDLSGAKDGTNGRHPLPDRQAFASCLAAHGVGPSTQVVVYDAHGGMYASRLWWMCRWIGHEAVAVLDGGIPQWIGAGLPLEATTPTASPRATLPVGPSLGSTVDAGQILADLSGRRRLVVDARSPDRYRGENETIDPVGGRIPGAVNRFFKENLEPDGRFKPADQLRHELSRRFGGIASDRVVAQCGSGVTACHNLLAMEIAGLPGASLYPGSWSEWCSDPARPIEQGYTAYPCHEERE